MAATDHSPILGLEAAGTVMEVGSEVGSKFKAGDRVMALCNGGAYAEQVPAPVIMLRRLRLSCKKMVYTDALTHHATPQFLFSPQVVVDAGSVLHVPSSWKTYEAARLYGGHPHSLPDPSSK